MAMPKRTMRKNAWRSAAPDGCTRFKNGPYRSRPSTIDRDEIESMDAAETPLRAGEGVPEISGPSGDQELLLHSVSYPRMRYAPRNGTLDGDAL
jgi:hypothetical protein